MDRVSAPSLPPRAPGFGDVGRGVGANTGAAVGFPGVAVGDGVGRGVGPEVGLGVGEAMTVIDVTVPPKSVSPVPVWSMCMLPVIGKSGQRLATP